LATCRSRKIPFSFFIVRFFRNTARDTTGYRLTGEWIYMAIDFESKRQTARRNCTSLSSKSKNRIKETVGKCEFCDTTYPSDSLEVYMPGMPSRPPQRPDENPANGFIVLCKEHYLQVCEGEILKSTLKSKIAKRPEKIKRALRSLLEEKHDRTYEGSNITKTHDPIWFSVGGSVQEKPGRRL